MNKKEVNKICRLADKIQELKEYFQEHDEEMASGDGTISEQLDCALASLDCILENYYNHI